MQSVMLFDCIGTGKDDGFGWLDQSPSGRIVEIWSLIWMWFIFS